MSDKRRFTISLPEHVAEELARHSGALSSTPSEYAADIIRWWYGQGSPALSAEEERVLALKKKLIAQRVA